VERFPDPVNDALKLRVLVSREVRDAILAMLPRRDERVPDKRGKPVQERDRKLVLVDDVVR
jgi:hypothetical protein